MNSARSRLAGFAVAAITAIFVVGCGSSGSGSNGTTGGSASPITVGYVNDQTGLSPDVGVTSGEQAALKYVNSDLHGIDGHPLKVVACATASTPESSQSCAQQIIAAKPVALMRGHEVSSNTSEPLYAAAEIPQLGEFPLGTTEFSAPDSHEFVSGSDFPAWASYFLSKGYKNIAYLTVDIPQAQAQLQIPFQKALENAGVTVHQIPMPETATDMTPYIQEAMDYHPDAILVVGITPQCVAALQAKATLGYKGAFAETNYCGIPSVVSAVGDAVADGTEYMSNFDYTDTSNPDVVLFNKEWSKYGTGTPTNDNRIGFALVMNTVTVIKAAGGASATPASITKYLNTAKNVPNFMAHPFTCNHEQDLSGQHQAVCNGYSVAIQVENGQFVNSSSTYYSGIGLKY